MDCKTQNTDHYHWNCIADPVISWYGGHQDQLRCTELSAGYSGNSKGSGYYGRSVWNGSLLHDCSGGYGTKGCSGFERKDRGCRSCEKGFVV